MENSQQCVSQAQELLGRGVRLRPSDARETVKRLKKANAFGPARRLLARTLRAPGVERHADYVWLVQQHAVCTYKDADLPADARLDRALEILCDGEELSGCSNQETLGIAGAIHKRRWEIDGKRQHLERSLFYYLRGYAEGAPAGRRADLFAYLREPGAEVSTKDDRGYTGINAAFVLDQLAHLEEKEAQSVGFEGAAAAVEEKREQARLIRLEIIRTLGALERAAREEANEEREKARQEPLPDEEPVTDWWFHATLGEAHFGVADYVNADKWLVGKAAGLDIPDWELESSARQLATLAHLQAPPGRPIDERARAVLQSFLKQDATALESTMLGKVGVGLSGGGFRASLYHIGVLARLAELDVLRHVEVLSCVSGGSIVGAHYYLEVRGLLERKRDEEITKQDYLDIVSRLELNFLAGVKKNIRTRIAAQFVSNLKMIFSKRYSRTMRAGDLYERHLFAPAAGKREDEPVYLDELRITPKGYAGAGREFKPQRDNWRRAAKAPVLILNAATLNTGHTWHFTASYMGEPPAGIDSEIDGNDYYRRMYYGEAPAAFRKVRLGHAVAASACVQGVFEPLAFEGLYDGRTVRLVDGGTCDNQGVGGLLEQDCNVVLISDGSGQMGTQNQPSPGLLGVPLRSVNIVQARVRAAQYRDLRARRRSGLLRGLMFVHLKGDLDVAPVNWVGCRDPLDLSDDPRQLERRRPLTGYRIAKDIQRRLSAVRTDLDSFNDVEAYALMTSGYRMTEQAFAKGYVPGFEGATRAAASPAGDGTPRPRWNFLQVEKGMGERCEQYEHVERLLKVSPNKAFKVWMLHPLLKALAVVLGVLAAVGVVLAFVLWRDHVVFQALTLGGLGVAILTYLANKVATMVLGEKAMQVIQWRSTLTRAGVGLGLALFGTVAALLHILVFDRLYLRLGSIEKFNELSRAGGEGAGTNPGAPTAGD